jgi:hypothetical protein
LIPIPGFENYSIDETGKVTNTNSGRVLKPSLNENGYLYVHLWKDGKSHSRTAHRLVAEVFIKNPDKKPFVNHIDANRSNPHKDNLEWCTQAENIAHAYRIGNMSQKQNFTSEELDWLLDEFLKNKTMTALAENMKVGLSRMTINLRNRAILSGRSAEFEAMLVQQKNARNTAANAEKRIPVSQLNSTGEVIMVFPSATAAARALGKTSSGPIHNALNPNNLQKKAYGYQWKYA